MNVCVTGGAGAYVPFPGWVAVTGQVPAPRIVTVLPAIVQLLPLPTE